MSSSASPSDSSAAYPVQVQPRDFHAETRPADGGTECFDTAEALDLNRARLEHFGALNLTWEGKSVLDIGCGVGHLSAAVAQWNGGRVTGVDGREGNIRVFRERHPGLQADVANVEEDLTRLGLFDVVLCCGLLYHVENPWRALRNIATVCRELLIVETIICDHELPVAVWEDETKSVNQALHGLGCRPSPSLITLALNRIGFPWVFAPLQPPRHREFEVRWSNSLAWSQDGHVIRAVFLGSRTFLDNPELRLLCGDSPSWYCKDYRAGNEIPGAISITDKVLHNSTEVRQEKPLTIVSSPEPWAYGAAFPLRHQPLQESVEAGPILIKADMTVQSGEVRVAGVSEDLTEMVADEAVLSAEQGRQQLEFAIPAPERCGWVIFRNGASGGKSEFEIHDLAVYRALERR